MKDNPVVSVLMPVYNSERYLSQAIESILAQTFTNFEFLIFDDGSTDNSKGIIADFAQQDSRIKAFYADHNQGYVVHLNQGIQIARGKYIARMDSDDISLSNRLEIQLKYLESHPNVGALGSSSIRIDTNGNELGLSKRMESPVVLFWLSFFTNPLSHPTVILRKDVLSKVGNYNENKQPSEDYDLWTRILIHADIANVSKPLLKYREHENSISVKKRETQLRNSSETLKEHWFRSFKINISDNEVLFLKQFHKGYDEVEPNRAYDIFFKIFVLYKSIKSIYGKIPQEIELDFLKKSIYLFTKLKSVTFIKSLKLVSLLLLTSPIRFPKYLIYGKL